MHVSTAQQHLTHAARATMHKQAHAHSLTHTYMRMCTHARRAGASTRAHLDSTPPLSSAAAMSELSRRMNAIVSGYSSLRASISFSCGVGGGVARG